MPTTQTATKTTRKPRLVSADYIQELADLGYKFKMDLRDDSIWVNDERLTDSLAAEIRVKMRDRKSIYRRHIRQFEDAYIAEARANSFHPIKDYLASLAWDGGQHISQLSIHFRDRHGMFHTYLRRWLVGAVARVHTGAQNAMLVIEGEQDLGKSFFARWLCPLSGMYIDKEIRPDNKDDLIFLITYWIWEVGELGATTRKADRESLKSFISREKIDVRKPYGHYPISKPALASFIGTFNDEGGILSDPTGNRRFNVCALLEIDWNYKHDVVLDQVWAEAQAAYFSGEDWRLTGDEKKKQQEINEDFRVPDAIEDLLRKHFNITYNRNDWISSADILMTLQNGGLNGNTRANSMALAATMKRLGLEKYQFNNQKGYWGIK